MLNLGMGLSRRTIRRRWLGVIALSLALLLLLADETFLGSRLRGWSYLGYWFACLICTCVALWVALQDARELRIRTRQEERDLLETTLKEVEIQARQRQPQEHLISSRR